MALYLGESKIDFGVYQNQNIMNVRWHNCPEPVQNYVDEVTYNSNDYTTSQIQLYAPSSAVSSNTKPVGYTVDDITYYNQIPNHLTPFASENSAGTLNPYDRIRWINSLKTMNVRDIGGWACDGGTIKYGKIIRGAEPDSQDVKLFIDEIGVCAELELQGTEGSISNAFDGKVDYCCPSNGSYWAYYQTILNNKDQVKQAIEFVISCVCHNKPVYVHCSVGADRTGTVICILEGILGVAQSDCDKDYELSSFAGNGDNSFLRKRCGRTEQETGTVAETQYKDFISKVSEFDGNTFRDKLVNFVLSCGITVAEINEFRAAMIDGSPETLSPNVNSYTVSQSLSGVTSDNIEKSSTQYQPYKVNILPETGKVISSLKITMNGNDITSSAFSGVRTNMRHSIQLTLNHCESNNNKKAVIDGEGYGCIIYPSAGYKLDGAEILMTMGGNDMSSYYSSGMIAIPRVTGDIVISVTAISSAVSYDNLFDKSKMHEGQRINSGAQLEANSAWNVSNDISYEQGSTSIVRIKGLESSTAADGRICYSADSGTSWYHAVYMKNETNFSYDAVNDIVSFILYNPNPSMFRISFPSSLDVDNLIITVNEEII